MWRFFPEDCNRSRVSPAERLIACWSHLVFTDEASPDVLLNDMKRDKKDIEVVQRLRMIQAACITARQGSYFLQTGDEMTKRINKEISFRGRSADKRDAAEHKRE